MPKIEDSIEVQVPIQQAYNQWTQFEEFPKFMEGSSPSSNSTTRTCVGSRRSAAIAVGERRRSPSSSRTERSLGGRSAAR
jgi:hypothetical protein